MNDLGHELASSYEKEHPALGQRRRLEKSGSYYRLLCSIAFCDNNFSHPPKTAHYYPKGTIVIGRKSPPDNREKLFLILANPGTEDEKTLAAIFVSRQYLKMISPLEVLASA